MWSTQSEELALGLTWGQTVGGMATGVGRWACMNKLTCCHDDSEHDDASSPGKHGSHELRRWVVGGRIRSVSLGRKGVDL